MKYVIVGHKNPDVDSILSGILLQRILQKKHPDNNYRYVIFDKEVDSITRGILSSIGIDVSQYQQDYMEKDEKVILVDHYDGSGLNNHYDEHINDVVAIFDHHPIPEGFEFVHKPDTYFNTQSCSATTVIFNTFRDEISREDFILVLIGALVDTVSFISTKTNEKEMNELLENCRKLDIDPTKYLDLGYCLNDLKDLGFDSTNGLKSCVLYGKNVQSSYIQIKDAQAHEQQINEIIGMLRERMMKNNYDIHVFIVYDLKKPHKTIEYDIYRDHIDVLTFKTYASRGSTILPTLELRLGPKKQGKVIV